MSKKLISADGRVHFRTTPEQHKHINKQIEQGKFETPSMYLRNLIDRDMENE